MDDAAKGLDFAGLASRQVRLLVLLPVPLWALDKYAATQPALAPYLACDPSAAVFSALHCGFSFATAKLRPDSIHAHTGVLAATWKGLVQGVTGGMQGDPRQMGGALVLQGGSKVVWQHRDAYNADQVPIPVLLAAAGVDPSLYNHKGACA
jgi:hypothetical protein